MPETRMLLFDAANTLIHKPALWVKMDEVLTRHGFRVDPLVLQQRHKLLSECTVFPDNTSAAFYRGFNTELLYSLGIIPTDALLNDLFEACTYLPWEPFEDTAVLKELAVPMGILSNFNTSLSEKINSLFGGVFSTIITSEELGCAKPARAFYEAAIGLTGCDPREVLYIGDSLKLDVVPALELGMQVLLIDRLNLYPLTEKRIRSLESVQQFIQ